MKLDILIFDEMSLHAFCACSNWNICGFFSFLLLSFWKFFVYSLLIFIGYMVHKYFLIHYSCLFILISGLFSCGKFLHFDDIRFIGFSLYVLCFWFQV